jgi:hypothetical protein
MTTLIARPTTGAAAEDLLSLLDLAVGIEESPAYGRGRWASVVPLKMTDAQSIAVAGGILAQVHLAPNEPIPTALEDAVQTFNTDTRAGWLNALDQGLRAQLATHADAITRLTGLRAEVTGQKSDAGLATLSVNIVPETQNIIRRRRAQNGSTATALVRNGLHLLNVLLDEVAAGGRIRVHYPDRTTRDIDLPD